jgi:Flp pilus assembly protein TadD
MMPTRVLNASRTGPIDAAPIHGTTEVVTVAPRGPKTAVAAPGAKTTVAMPRDVKSAVATARTRRIAWAIGISIAILIAVAIGSRGAIRGARARAALRQGIAAYRGGRQTLARERLLAASSLAPSDPSPHVFLSRLAREANDLNTANAEAVKAVKLAPNDGAALRELATTLYAMQNFTAARAFYVRAIQADPGNHNAQGYLGCSLIQLGRVEEGMRWIQRAGSGTWSACTTRVSLNATP